MQHLTSMILRLERGVSDKEIVRLLTQIERRLRKIQQVVAPDPDLSIAEVAPAPEVVELVEQATKRGSDFCCGPTGHPAGRASSQAGLASFRPTRAAKEPAPPVRPFEDAYEIDREW